MEAAVNLPTNRYLQARGQVQIPAYTMTGGQTPFLTQPFDERRESLYKQVG